MRTEPPTIDHVALLRAIDTERQRRGVTWRQVAYVMNVPPSTFTRLSRGGLPAATALVRMLLWLDQTDLAPYIRRAT